MADQDKAERIDRARRRSGGLCARLANIADKLESTEGPTDVMFAAQALRSEIREQEANDELIGWRDELFELLRPWNHLGDRTLPEALRDVFREHGETLARVVWERDVLRVEVERLAEASVRSRVVTTPEKIQAAAEAVVRGEEYLRCKSCGTALPTETTAVDERCPNCEGELEVTREMPRPLVDDLDAARERLRSEDADREVWVVVGEDREFVELEDGDGRGIGVTRDMHWSTHPQSPRLQRLGPLALRPTPADVDLVTRVAMTVAGVTNRVLEDIHLDGGVTGLLRVEAPLYVNELLDVLGLCELPEKHSVAYEVVARLSREMARLVEERDALRMVIRRELIATAKAQERRACENTIEAMCSEIMELRVKAGDLVDLKVLCWRLLDRDVGVVIARMSRDGGFPGLREAWHETWDLLRRMPPPTDAEMGRAPAPRCALTPSPAMVAGMLAEDRISREDLVFGCIHGQGHQSAIEGDDVVHELRNGWGWREGAAKMIAPLGPVPLLDAKTTSELAWMYATAEDSGWTVTEMWAEGDDIVVRLRNEAGGERTVNITNPHPTEAPGERRGADAGASRAPAQARDGEEMRAMCLAAIERAMRDLNECAERERWLWEALPPRLSKLLEAVLAQAKGSRDAREIVERDLLMARMTRPLPGEVFELHEFEVISENSLARVQGELRRLGYRGRVAFGGPRETSLVYEPALDENDDGSPAMPNIG